jgi:D-amino-acid oxidase
MAPDLVVVGAGIAGLCTARQAQQRGLRPRVIARELPTETTSAVAAAIWYPYLAAHPQVERWAEQTRRWLTSLAADRRTGVHMQRVREQSNGELSVDDIVPVADTRTFLPWLAAQVEAAGGTIERIELQHLDEARAMAPLVANCTGLGARQLCRDAELTAVRGQIVVAASDAVDCAWIDDSSDAPVYIIPRGDEVVLGGTAQQGDTRTEVDDGDTLRILADCRSLVPALEDAVVQEVRVGLRPFRPRIRVEIDTESDDGRLVHHYGHGGSGFTLAWGSAATAVELLLSQPPT